MVCNITVHNITELNEFFSSGQEWSEGDVMASKRKQEETDEPVDDRKLSFQQFKLYVRKSVKERRQIIQVSINWSKNYYILWY